MTANDSPQPSGHDDLKGRAVRLGLYGLLAHWSEVAQEPWLPRLIDYEEHERQRRSLERRIRPYLTSKMYEQAETILLKDPDFQRYKDHPRFKALLEKIRKLRDAAPPPE